MVVIPAVPPTAWSLTEPPLPVGVLGVAEDDVLAVVGRVNPHPDRVCRHGGRPSWRSNSSARTSSPRPSRNHTAPGGARKPEYQAWPIAVPHGRPGGQLGAVTGAATEGDAAVLAFDGHSVTVDTEPVAQRVKFPHPASHRRLLGQVST